MNVIGKGWCMLSVLSGCRIHPQVFFSMAGYAVSRLFPRPRVPSILIRSPPHLQHFCPPHNLDLCLSALFEYGLLSLLIVSNKLAIAAVELCFSPP